MTALCLVLCAVCLVLVGVCFLFKKQRDAAVLARIDAVKSWSDETTLLQVTADVEKTRREEILKELKKVTVKLDTHLRFNEDAIKERDGMWKKFLEASLAAGHAQAWMLRELEEKLNELNNYRRKAGLSPANMPAVFQASHEAFVKEYVTEPLKDRKFGSEAIVQGVAQ